jgi:hypothetical protein
MLDGPKPVPTLQHLPAHLGEVCQLLALALVRLRRRTAEELARDAAGPRGRGDVPLHFFDGRSVDAEPEERGPSA